MSMGKNRIVFDTTNTADSDSIGSYLRSSDGTLLTHTNNGGKQSLDVNVSNTSIAVTATDLDIRDLSHAQDSVKIGDGTDLMTVTAAGEANVIESNLTSLRKLEDAAHVSGDSGIQMLVVRSDAGGSLVSADGDYSPLQVDSSGRLRTATTITSVPSDKAEDAAHASGDTGTYTLSVRQDTPASSTSADGDYQSFKTDALGRMWMNNASASFAHNATSVASTATDLVATDLANRKRILIQNASTRKVFLGNSTVTIANGIELSPGAALELDAAAAVDLYGITAAGTADVRIMELA